MPDIKKILFPTDFSELANHALPYAIKMAQVFDAELIMLHAITLHEHDPNNPEHTFPSLESYCSEVVTAANNGLELCIENLGDRGVRIKKAVLQGISPHAVILEFMRDEADISMVVMSTHGRSGLSHVLLGSVTESVIRYAGCPVLVVKNPEHEFIDAGTGEIHLKKILFPIDFSENSIKPLKFVKFIAEMHGSEVSVFHAVDVEIPPVYYTAGVDSALELDSGLEDRVVSMMEEMVGDGLSGVDVRYVMSEGRVADKIREYAADNEIDLLIIGSEGEQGVGEMLLGSTTARVIQKAVCPVMVV